MQQRSAEKRLMSRQAARKRKLAEAGIVYNFEKVAYVSAAAPRTRSARKDLLPHRRSPKAHHDDLYLVTRGNIIVHRILLSFISARSDVWHWGL